MKFDGSVLKQGMGLREASVPGLPDGDPAGPEVRDPGEERVRDGGAHVGERRRRGAAQDGGQDPVLPLPQLHHRPGGALPGAPPGVGGAERDVVRQAALRLRRQHEEARPRHQGVRARRHRKHRHRAVALLIATGKGEGRGNAQGTHEGRKEGKKGRKTQKKKGDCQKKGMILTVGVTERGKPHKALIRRGWGALVRQWRHLARGTRIVVGGTLVAAELADVHLGRSV